MQDAHIGYLMKAIHQQLKANVDAGLKRHGLTLSQGRVLCYLERMGGSASQKEIETHLAVSHPTAAGLVSRLAQGGFVVCRQNESDRRNKLVILTERARQAGRDMKQVIDRQESNMLAGFTAEETGRLTAALQKILRNLEQ